MEQSSENLLRLSMELGGNAPFLVFADADIDAAVERRDDRQDAQHGRVVRRGEPLPRRTSRSPRSSPAQLAEKHGRADGRPRHRGGRRGRSADRRDQRGKVAELVDDAVDKGAAVLVGG